MAAASPPPLNVALAESAAADATKFSSFFRTMRKSYPQEVMEACLWYIATHGLNPAGQQMAFWLSTQSKYMEVLLDPTVLPKEAAVKALAALRSADPQFFGLFIKAAATVNSQEGIFRVLELLPAVGDFSPLLPMLRGWGEHPNQKVRSKVAKVICALRPNKALVDRQMASDDARVRASAIEALWHASCAEKVQIFRAALSDAHHRVVGNALVGLYLTKDQSAFEKMVELSEHPKPLFRSAMAWALGHILDLRGIPVLERMAQDASLTVKRRAMQSLVGLQTLQLQTEEAELAAAQKVLAEMTAAKTPTNGKGPNEPEAAKSGPTPRFLTF